MFRPQLSKNTGPWMLTLLSASQAHSVPVLKSRKGKPETHWKNLRNHRDQTWPSGPFLLTGLLFGGVQLYVIH